MSLILGIYIYISPVGQGMPVLDWAKRIKIALGSAKGLAYLHEDCMYYVSLFLLISHLLHENEEQIV
jgi:hypothetical protein